MPSSTTLSRRPLSKPDWRMRGAALEPRRLGALTHRLQRLGTAPGASRGGAGSLRRGWARHRALSSIAACMLLLDLRKLHAAAAVLSGNATIVASHNGVKDRASIVTSCGNHQRLATTAGCRLFGDGRSAVLLRAAAPRSARATAATRAAALRTAVRWRWRRRRLHRRRAAAPAEAEDAHEPAQQAHLAQWLNSGCCCGRR